MTELQDLKRISIVDLSFNYQLIRDEINKAVEDVLVSGKYILGPNVNLFEKEFADYTGSAYAVSCANGTDALVLALKALNIKEGDEVITVSHSFFATSEAIALVGAKPVFVDVLETDFNINPDQVTKLITNKTKVIIPVHLYGQSCDIDKVAGIAQKHKLYLIEDCAQAAGAKYKGEHVGTFGDIGAFSFFPTKNLGAFGDGGAIITKDISLAEKIKQLRSHGSSRRYEHKYIGLNSRLDEIQAACLRIKLKYLDEWNLKRKNAAAYYNKLLSDIESVKIPVIKPECKHVFHQYTIQLKNKKMRDILHQELNNLGIESIIYYPLPIHLQDAFSYLGYKEGELPVTEKIAGEILSLPIYPEITPEVQKHIVSSIRNILETAV